MSRLCWRFVDGTSWKVKWRGQNSKDALKLLVITLLLPVPLQSSLVVTTGFFLIWRQKSWKAISDGCWGAISAWTHVLLICGLCGLCIIEHCQFSMLLHSVKCLRGEPRPRNVVSHNQKFCSSKPCRYSLEVLFPSLVTSSCFLFMRWECLLLILPISRKTNWETDVFIMPGIRRDSRYR